ESLFPVLTGEAATVHDQDQPLGYELAGNSALFKGEYKLVKNLPPYGDGAWHLYNIVRDPGETRDLAAMEPDRVAAMLADYTAYARADGVLAMPAGYSAPAQIAANVRRTVLIPRLLGLWPTAAGLVAVIAGLVWWRRQRRRINSK
ncbi:MAG: arylsulfatase, partial [Novosphingobium sp.]